MSSTEMEDVKNKEVSNDAPNDQVDRNKAVENKRSSDAIEEHSMPSSKQEEEVVRKKYGGLLPKKPPLIAKDHEHAFFDSADWALGKQGVQKPKGPLEALRPKLQPTPHQQMRVRRPAYASGDNTQEHENDNVSPEDPSYASAGDNNRSEENGDNSGNNSNDSPEKH